MPRIILFSIIVSLNFACQNKKSSSTEIKLPNGFVHLKEHIPGIVLDARYFGTNNFIGQRIRKYESDNLIIGIEAANALVNVQQELKTKGLELKVFDAYRPQGAVDHFVEWAKDLNDTLMKAQFYPDVDKSELFDKGYIAAKSGHSRGSTIDLTIIDSDTRVELDMGTTFDFFSPKSWPTDTTVTTKQFENQMLLQTLMEKHNFKHLPEEWWHFTLNNEPYPDTYFEFSVR